MNGRHIPGRGPRAGGCPTARQVLLAAGILASLAAPTALFEGAARATTSYYFAPTGIDSSTCPQTSPCRTLARANQLPLAPGDRIYFRRDGQWTGTLKVTASGASGSNIIVGAYGTGGQPKITDSEPGQPCVALDGHWITLDNLETSNCGYAGVRVAGDNVIVKYMTSARNVAGISVAAGADRGLYERNRLLENDRMAPGKTGADDDSGAFGFLIAGNGNEVRDNFVRGSDAPSPDYERDGCAVEIYGASSTRVHHNTAVNNNCFTELGTPAGQPSDGNIFEYNVITSSERGLDVPKAGSKSSALVTRANTTFGPVTNTKFRNNSISLHGNGTSLKKVSALVCYGGCTGTHLELRSNAIRVSGAGSQTGWVDNGFRNTDFNVFWPSLPVQMTKGYYDVVADPKFASATDLHVTSASPAVDRGCTAYWTFDRDHRSVPVDIPAIENGPRCAGDPDAGAYEVQF